MRQGVPTKHTQEQNSTNINVVNIPLELSLEYENSANDKIIQSAKIYIECTLNEKRWRNAVHLMVFASLNFFQTAKFGGMLADRNLTNKPMPLKNE